MQDALPIVIVAVVVIAGLVGAVAVLTSRGPYDRIGSSDLTFDREGEGADDDRVREAEIVELLARSNARRAARGLAPRDASAFAPAPDPALEAEVRAAVQARSDRRVARGQAPLDVDAEVERRLSSPDG